MRWSCLSHLELVEGWTPQGFIHALWEVHNPQNCRTLWTYGDIWAKEHTIMWKGTSHYRVSLGTQEAKRWTQTTGREVWQHLPCRDFTELMNLKHEEHHWFSKPNTAMFPSPWFKFPDQWKKRAWSRFSVTVSLSRKQFEKKSLQLTALLAPHLNCKGQRLAAATWSWMPHLGISHWASLPSRSANRDRSCLAFRPQEALPFSLPFRSHWNMLVWCLLSFWSGWLVKELL